MKVILTENIKGLGQIGETLEVKNGYARNFLMPRHLAILATAENLKQIGELKKKKDIAVKDEIKIMKDVAEKLNNFRLLIEAKTSEKGHLYAAINSKNITDVLKGRGIEMNPNYILMSEPIKELGIHPVLFKYYDIETSFEVEVVKI